MFKKVSCVLSAFLIAVGAWFIGNKPRFNGYADGFTVYTGDYSSVANAVFSDGLTYFALTDKTGESVAFDGVADKDAIFAQFNACERFSEKIADGVNYYGYTRDIPYFVLVRGERVNLQVFVGKTRSAVGTPIIYGSF